MSASLRHLIRTAININTSNLIQVRYYPRWAHRRPTRVILPEEPKKMEDIEENVTARNIQNDESIEPTLDPKNIKWKLPGKGFTQIEPQGVPINFEGIDRSEIISSVEKKKKVLKPRKQPQSVDMLETIIDKDGNFVFEKMKDNDSRVGSLFLTVKSRKNREKNKLILLEGKRLIKEALENGCRLKNLVFSRKDELEFLKPYLPKTGAKLYKMPYREMQVWSDLTTCPGIMGIFKAPECEDFQPPQNHLPITVICDNIREPGNLGAILRNCAGLACHKVILTSGCVDLWDTKVTRSSAGAHFRLQIHRKLPWDEIRSVIPPDAKVYVADNKIITETLKDHKKPNLPKEENQINLVEIVKDMPLLPYYSITFNDFKPIVLIVGGETEGISEESYRFAHEKRGIRLNIPLENGVDSLNTGTALGIIAFEIKRQLKIFKHSTDKSESGKTYINVGF